VKLLNGKCKQYNGIENAESICFCVADLTRPTHISDPASHGKPSIVLGPGTEGLLYLINCTVVLCCPNGPDLVQCATIRGGLLHVGGIRASPRALQINFALPNLQNRVENISPMALQMRFAIW